MPSNPATLKAITALTTFRGVSHNARGDILDEPIREVLEFQRAATGRKSRIPSLVGFKVTMPVVATVAQLLPLLQYYQGAPFGRNIGPHPFLVENLNPATEVLTITAHPFATEDTVQVAWDETAPTLGAGTLSQSTTYYVRSLSANTISLHPTANDATNNTNAINFTAAGTGDLWITRQLPLVVHRRSGVKRTYTNAVVEAFPDLVMSGGKLAFEGNLVFRVLPALGSSPDDGTAAFYAETAAAFVPPAWTGNEALTRPVSAAWGAVAPWNDFRSEAGFRAAFRPTLQPFDDGVWPGASLHYTDFAVELRGKPFGVTVPELQAAMVDELGALLDGEDLVLTGSDFVLTLKQAILNPAATVYSPANGIAQELTWIAGGDGASDLRAPFTIATP